jgi:hypothetical protein
MSTYDTRGWDVMLQLGETELDDVLACRFATGDLQFPLGGEFRFGPASVDLRMLYDTPRARLVTDAGTESEPGVRLVVPFDESFVRFSVPFSDGDDRVSGQETDLRGEVHYTAPLRLHTAGDDHRLVVVAADATSDVQLTEETRSALSDEGEVYASIYESSVSDPDPTVARRLRNLPTTVSERVEQEVTGNAGSALPTTDLDIAFEAADATLAVVDGPTSDDRCLLVGADLTADETGAHGPFDACARPRGTTAALSVSTDFLLSEVLCPRLADELNLSEDDFEDPCRLASPTRTSVSGESFEVESLSVSVRDGDVVVDGEVRAERDLDNPLGGDVVVTGSVDVRVDVTYDPGSGDVVLRVTNSDVDVTVDVPWYVEVASWFVADLQVAIGMLPDLVGGVAEGLLSDVGGRFGASDRLNALLDDRLDHMMVDAFDLTSEALVVGGGLLPDRHCSAAAAGTVVLRPGESVDLDAGATSRAQYVQKRDTDLRWGDVEDDPLGRRALQPRHGGEVTRLGTDDSRGNRFRTTSVVDLDSLPDDRWTDDRIPERELFFFDRPFVGQRRLLSGAFTSDGRYAKCTAYRTGGGSLRLRYHTFQRPTPEVEITTDRTVTDQKQVDEGVDHWTAIECRRGGPAGPQVETYPRTSPYTVYERARRLDCSATATRLAWPLSFDWSLAGEPIEGTGTVTIDGTEIDHEVDGPTCTLWLDRGDSLLEDLEVEVTDNRGLDVVHVHPFTVRGRVKEGGRPENIATRHRQVLNRCRPERELTGPDEWPDRVGLPGEHRFDPGDWPVEADPREVREALREARRELDGRATDPERSLSPGESTTDEIRRALSEGLELPADALDEPW